MNGVHDIQILETGEGKIFAAVALDSSIAIFNHEARIAKHDPRWYGVAAANVKDGSSALVGHPLPELESLLNFHMDAYLDRRETNV